jgi:hypothetical protein
MPPKTVEPTPSDRAAWARLWQIARRPWESTDKLAKFLGYSRQAIEAWCPKGKNEGSGSWPLLRAALKEAAQENPEAVPAMVQALAAELLDARGTWVPATGGDGGEDLDWSEERADVDEVRGEAVRLVRAAAPATQLELVANRIRKESDDEARALEQLAARRRAGRVA